MCRARTDSGGEREECNEVEQAFEAGCGDVHVVVLSLVR